MTLKLTAAEAAMLMEILAAVEAEYREDEASGTIAFLADPKLAKAEAALAEKLYRRIEAAMGSELMPLFTETPQ